MGKLSISGRAEREVVYNAAELTVTFNYQAKTTTAALKVVQDQSEEFLHLITKAGVHLKEIHIGENSISQRRYDDTEFVRVTREIIIRLNFDLAFINGLMDLIREQDFSVNLNCQYKLKNKQELHTELLKEALEDSRKKAEFIANTMESRIIGIDYVEHDGSDDSDWLCCESELRFPVAGSAPSLSDQLEAPLTTESESINVVWLIE